MNQLGHPLHVALVHDWLTGMRGGEKCLEVLCELFPDAPIYTLFHVKGAMSPLIEGKEIHTSFIQHLPLVEQKYRMYLPLFPPAIESFDFSRFDVIISTSHCVAKGAIPRQDALHVCYCHTPMRYVYEMYEEYFGRNRAGIATRSAMAVIAPLLRRWDKNSAKRVHHYVANSQYVRTRIQRHYRREAEVIFPPVDTSRFQLSTKNEGYYLIVSALVPYKRVDLAIHAFNRVGKRLVIVGKGPDEQKLRTIAGSTIEFAGWKSDDELPLLYERSQALVFPGEEDFGIVPLEAMACGKPVIAYGKGGVLETVQDGLSGVFFWEQTVEAIEDAIKRVGESHFDPGKIRNSALRFSRSSYKETMRKFIDARIQEHFSLSKDVSSIRTFVKA